MRHPNSWRAETSTRAPTAGDLLLYAGFLVAWVLLQRWLLPRLGVPT